MQPKKPKIIEYVEPEKDFLTENKKILQNNKKKSLKKIGGVFIDEDSFKSMLKNFKPEPKTSRNNNNIPIKAKTEFIPANNRANSNTDSEKYMQKYKKVNYNIS